MKSKNYNFVPASKKGLNPDYCRLTKIKRSDYPDGVSVADLVEELGIPKRTIHTFLKKLGVEPCGSLLVERNIIPVYEVSEMHKIGSAFEEALKLSPRLVIAE